MSNIFTAILTILLLIIGIVFTCSIGPLIRYFIYIRKEKKKTEVRYVFPEKLFDAEYPDSSIGDSEYLERRQKALSQELP